MKQAHRSVTELTLAGMLIARHSQISQDGRLAWLSFRSISGKPGGKLEAFSQTACPTAFRVWSWGVSQEGLRGATSQQERKGHRCFYFRGESFIFNIKAVHNSCKSPEKHKERKHYMEFPCRVKTPVSSGADMLPEISFFAQIPRDN